MTTAEWTTINERFLFVRRFKHLLTEEEARWMDIMLDVPIGDITAPEKKCLSKIVDRLVGELA